MVNNAFLVAVGGREGGRGVHLESKMQPRTLSNVQLVDFCFASVYFIFHALHCTALPPLALLQGRAPSGAVQRSAVAGPGPGGRIRGDYNRARDTEPSQSRARRPAAVVEAAAAGSYHNTQPLGQHSAPPVGRIDTSFRLQSHRIDVETTSTQSPFLTRAFVNQIRLRNDA